MFSWVVDLTGITHLKIINSHFPQQLSITNSFNSDGGKTSCPSSIFMVIFVVAWDLTQVLYILSQPLSLYTQNHHCVQKSLFPCSFAMPLFCILSTHISAIKNWLIWMSNLGMRTLHTLIVSTLTS